MNKFNLNKRNSILKNVFLLLSSNVVSQSINLLIFIFIARMFGPVSFGQLNWSNAIVQYFMLLSVFGLQNIAMIDTIRDRNNLENLQVTYSRILSNRVILSIFSYALLLVFILIIPKDIETKLLTLLVGLTIFSGILNVGWFFNSFQQMELPAISDIIKTTLYCLLLVFAFSWSKSIYFVPIATFLSGIIAYTYLIRKSPLDFKLSFKLYDIGTLQRGYPFLISAIFATINLNADTVIIGLTRSNIEVGLYSSAYKIVMLFILVCTFVFSAVKPVMIDEFNKNNFLKLEELVRNIKKAIFVIAIPIAVSGYVISREIIVTIFGDQYQGASTVLGILLTYTALLFVREIYGYQLISYNLQKSYMKIVTVSSILNIILNILFIPIFGIVAAAITSLLSEIINLLLMRNACKPVLKAKLSNIFYIKIAISSGILYLILLLLKNQIDNAILLTLIGGVLYLSLIMLIRVTSYSQIKLLVKGMRE